MKTITDKGMRRKSGYGKYVVYGTVDGVFVSDNSTNSEAFDWMDDDSNPEKHEDALNYIDSVLLRRHEEMMNLL